MGSERPVRRPRARSQRRRRPRRRRWLVGLGLVGLLLVYLAITAAVAGTALRSARVEVAALRSAVAAGDDAALSAPLQRLQGDLGRARVATAGPVWWAAQQLPVIGDDVRAVRTVADVGDDLASGPLADLTPERVRGLTDGLVPKNGRVDLGTVARLAPLASELSDSADDAASRLAQVDPGGLVGPFGKAYADAIDQVGRLADGLEAARRATEVLPEVLGLEGPRTYVVMANNNAEVRATGGIAGPMVLLRAAGGRLTEVGSTSARAIGVFGRPVLPQPTAERAIYDTQVATYPQDVNFTPDFPRTAELLRAMLARRPGVEVDGVVGVDAVTLSYLLRSTGPLDVPGGPQLTADNATDELINQIYFRIPQPLRQDAYFGRVAQRVVDATLGGRPDPVALLSALHQSASEGRLHLHLFDADAQEAIAGTSLAGDVFDRSAPQVGLYLNDATGSKLSYYLRRSASLRSTSCTRGGHTLRGRAQLSYTADSPPVKDLPEYVTGGGAFGIPAGQQLLLARLYGPDGGTIGDVRLDGEELTEPAVDDRGRDVVTAAILLSRGQEAELTWEVTVADADAQVELSLSPGIEVAPAVATTAGCG